MITQMAKNYINHYRGIPPRAALIMLSIFMYALGYASIIFLPLYLHHNLHYSIAQTGVVLSAFGIGTIFASFYGGKLCDRFSPYAIAIISIVFYFFVLMAAYFIQRPDWLVASVLIFLGASSAMFSPASRIYLMQLIPVADQSRINGIRYMLFNIGTALSFGIAGWVIHENYQRVFLLSALCCVVVTLILFFTRVKSSTNREIKKEFKSKIRKDRILLPILASAFIGMLVFSQTNSSYTLFLSSQYHLTAHQLSSLFLINSLIIALFQVMLLNTFKSAPQLLLMNIGIAITGVGFFILLLGQTYLIAVVSILVITLGEMLCIPTSQNLVYQKAGADLKGHYMGIYQALYAATFMVTPLLSSFALTLNPKGLFLWSVSLVICFIPLLGFVLFHKNNAKMT